MTDTDAGSPDATSTPDPQGEKGERSNRKNQIMIAAIGAVALVAAAAIPVLLNQQGDTKSTVQVDPCDLDRLGDSWNQPPSQRFNESLFANHARPRVYSTVTQESNPEISVKGQFNLDVSAGQVLYLIRRPDPNTRDTFGNSGNNRYYPVTPVTPTSAGCWEDDNRPVGYPGVKGIGQIYMLVLVGRDQAAAFPADRKAKDWDGYNQDQWRAINSIDVMSFNVSTA
ncbi:hypothetical protein ABT278_42325 [Streptomyces sp. NPDC001228]|uniref:hypothetical protein n=1 Tax=Streptomyces sp. NPDC001228 TaxID=3154381 RepID=UPI0033266427